MVDQFDLGTDINKRVDYDNWTGECTGRGATFETRGYTRLHFFMELDDNEH